jgi:RND family efflux transporter MFP subunit
MRFFKNNSKLFVSFGIFLTIVGFAMVIGFPTARSSADGVQELSVDGGIFPVVHPVLMDTSYTVEYTANIEAIQYIDLKARVSGFIQHIHVDEGQAVKKGQVLFTLSGQAYEAKLAEAEAATQRARAEARTAEIEYRSVERLYNKGVVSETEVQLALAKLDALNAIVEESRSIAQSAKLDLSWTRITAPFDGVIGRIPKRSGSFIESGDAVTTISDNSGVYAYFSVSENDFLTLKTMLSDNGTTDISLRLSDHRTYPHRGTVQTMDNSFSKGSGTITFRASFPNPDAFLKHGSSGVVKLRRGVKDALIIPQSTTFEVQNKTFVFVVEENNTVQRKEVSIAHRLPHIFLLDGGVTPSERIVYEGLQHLSDGQVVTPSLVSFLSLQGHESTAFLQE